MDILNITEVPITDELIQEYEYQQYDPITGTNLDNSGEIRITIQSQGIFSHPCQSYLLVEGRLTKEDDTARVYSRHVWGASFPSKNSKFPPKKICRA